MPRMSYLMSTRMKATLLSQFFKTNLFGGIQEKSADAWSELLMNFGFSTKNSTILTDNSVLDGLEVLEKIEATGDERKDEDYWLNLIGETQNFGWMVLTISLTSDLQLNH